MTTIDGTQPHMKVWGITGVFAHQLSSMVLVNGANLNREGKNVALLSLPLSDASRLFVAGKIEQNPWKCFFNENQLTVWIGTRSGRVRVNKNTKVAG